MVKYRLPGYWRSRPIQRKPFIFSYVDAFAHIGSGSGVVYYVNHAQARVFNSDGGFGVGP